MKVTHTKTHYTIQDGPTGLMSPKRRSGSLANFLNKYFRDKKRLQEAKKIDAEITKSFKGQTAKQAFENPYFAYARNKGGYTSIYAKVPSSPTGVLSVAVYSSTDWAFPSYSPTEDLRTAKH